MHPPPYRPFTWKPKKSDSRHLWEATNYYCSDPPLSKTVLLTFKKFSLRVLEVTFGYRTRKCPGSNLRVRHVSLVNCTLARQNRSWHAGPLCVLLRIYVRERFFRSQCLGLCSSSFRLFAPSSDGFGSLPPGRKPAETSMFRPHDKFHPPSCVRLVLRMTQQDTMVTQELVHPYTWSG